MQKRWDVEMMTCTPLISPKKHHVTVCETDGGLAPS